MSNTLRVSDEYVSNTLWVPSQLTKAATTHSTTHWDSMAAPLSCRGFPAARCRTPLCMYFGATRGTEATLVYRPMTGQIARVFSRFQVSNWSKFSLETIIFFHKWSGLNVNEIMNELATAGVLFTFRNKNESSGYNFTSASTVNNTASVSATYRSTFPRLPFALQELMAERSDLEFLHSLYFVPLE